MEKRKKRAEDCKRSLFCSRIQGEERKRLSEHEIREASRRPATRGIAARARDSRSSPQILEQKRDCSQSMSASRRVPVDQQVVWRQCTRRALQGSPW